jgi:hypothetical protein
LVVSGPDIVDRESQTWGESWTPNPADSMEAAIFVLGHEEWHVKNPTTRELRKDEDIMNEANAHYSGKKALERWRNRKKP